MSVDVSVIIVTYNSRDWITRCVDTIDAALGPRSSEVVVLDNASTDGSADVAAGHRPGALIIRNPTNVGFAAAVNQAVARSSGSWVLLLNPDTELADGAIDALVRFAEAHPDNGVYGGRSVRADGTVDLSSCWALPTVWSLLCSALFLTAAPLPARLFDREAMSWWQRDSVREVGMVTGCLLLTPRSVWDELDGLDERYFVYGEDADFAARARARGYRPIITPDAVVMHEVGASSSDKGAKLVLLLAGKITYVLQLWTGWRRVLGLAILRGGAGLHALGSRLTGRAPQWRAAWAHRQRWWHGFPELPDRGAPLTDGGPSARHASPGSTRSCPAPVSPRP